ncbi:MAG TPA: hypothetical protein V6D46_10660 [Coleofasciculaceae cyanobacterium]
MAAAPAIEPGLLEAVEQLNYRVTVADVATQAGLDLDLTERGLMVLAASAGGNLQVAESGDVVYVFSREFRDVLRNKYWQLQLQETWSKVWKILFYLIRLSFGIVLILLIVAVIAAIAVAVLALNSSRSDDNNNRGSSDRSSSGGGGWGGYIPGGYYGGGWNWTWIFLPDYDDRSYEQQRTKPELNFLEAIYSFLFGDGNPNIYLEKERWQLVAQAIRHHGGSVVVEQIAPYLELPAQSAAQLELDEDLMLPVLVRFNGHPQVTEQGEIVYCFPELQTTVQADERGALPALLSEDLYAFSRATKGQKIGAIALGVSLLLLSLVLGGLLAMGDATEFGDALLFLQAVFGLGLGYSSAFLAVPVVRRWVIGRRNRAIEARNQRRSQWAAALASPEPELAAKLQAARTFAQQRTIIGDRDLTYTTEMDVVEQEALNPEAVDREWQRRLDASTSDPTSSQSSNQPAE